MKPPVRIGVIGTGRWAVQHHIPALLANPRARLVALADANPTRLAQARDRFGVERVFDGSEGLCASGLVDGVVVAVPNASHYGVARRSLDAGMHVLVEKPMTLDPAQAWDLVTRARTAGLHLVVGYPFHFSPPVHQARAVVATGALGRLHLTSGLFSSPRAHLYRRPSSNGVATLTEPEPGTYSDPALSGGGQGQTEATHALANLLHVTGLEVERVSAHMRRLDFPVDVIDVVTLEFTNGGLGSLASIGTVGGRHPLQREFRYYGDDGVLLQDLTTGVVRGHAGDGRRFDFGPIGPEELYPTHAPSACLIDLMTGGRDNPAPAELGARVVACLAAAYESTRRDGQPVAVAAKP